MIAPLTKKWSECPASESGSGDLFCPAYLISIAYAFRIVNTKIRCFRDEFSRSYSSPNCNFRSSHFKFCFAKGELLTPESFSYAVKQQVFYCWAIRSENLLVPMCHSIAPPEKFGNKKRSSNSLWFCAFSREFLFFVPSGDCVRAGSRGFAGFRLPVCRFFLLAFLDYRRFTISCSRLTQWRAASLSKVG